MRCKTCHYSLANLTPTESGEHRCPECGTPFDPNDPSTFAAGLPPSRALNWLVGMTVGLVMLIIAGLVVIAIMIVRANVPL